MYFTALRVLFTQNNSVNGVLSAEAVSAITS